MSIATEITRLQTAKADLKTAIEGKGVTVPSATTLDGYAELVGDIESGGGGSDTFADICNGTVTSYESTALLRIPANVLRSITTLTSFKAYNLQDINSYGLGGFRGTVIALPGFTGSLYNGGYAFSGANTLKTVDIGDKVIRFYSGFFNGASNLDTLIIRKSTVPSLTNVNVFNNTKFQSSGTGGTLYVPSALISSYESATNWSTILGYENNSIEAIEGSQYENYYADGTPIPTT